MKKLLVSAAALLMLLSGAAAQNGYPEGMTVYSLPNTVIGLDVTAVKESFTAGPYARYAQKYLGQPARTASGNTWTIKSVTVKYFTEADPDEIHAVKLYSSTSQSFLKFTSQGLVMFSDDRTSNGATWRFPYASDADFSRKDMGENLTSVTNTLYKSVKTEDGFSKVAVQQNEVVEKSPEKKAADAAQRIFDLRQSRLQITTGDTDASFSGEALGAAIREINRMEQEYLSLFFGTSEVSEQTAHFDVIPTPDNAKQMYVAFRISDEDGLIPSSTTSGRPVILSLNVEKKPAIQPLPADKRKMVAQAIFYRIPVTASIKLMEGQSTLISARIPVYQLGPIVSFPL